MAEFFNSVLLHNIIFSNTVYSLLVFVKESETLYAVLKQPFISANAQVELDEIKKLLTFNGFENNIRNELRSNLLRNYETLIEIARRIVSIFFIKKTTGPLSQSRSL